MISEVNPFTPGSGVRPPYLAGREREQVVFESAAGKILSGNSPDADIVMYGPRGVGKTVLLNWIRQKIPAIAGRNGLIHAHQAVPDNLSSSPTAIWEYLLPDDTQSRLLPDRIHAGIGGTGATWELKPRTETKLTAALVDECKKTPCMLLLDEAHTLEPEVCKRLLNLSQQLRNEQAPFLLVLAGTPGLRSFLNGVNATFCERSVMVGVGRLDEDSTAAAIREPLRADGIDIDADALATAVEDSQSYPYFIQLWGRELWDAAKAAELTHLTSREAAVAAAAVKVVREDFYLNRLDELRRSDILSAAVEVARAFQVAKSIDETELDRIIETTPLRARKDMVLQELIHRGFVWRPPESPMYEPGIPSLMAYAIQRRQDSLRTDAASRGQEDRDAGFDG